ANRAAATRRMPGIAKRPDGGSSMRRILLGVALLSLAATGCSVDLTRGQNATSAQDVSSNSRQQADPIVTVVKRVLPAVVNVTTVTAGIVSALDRTIQAQDPGCTVCRNGIRTYTNVVQTDAAINHGNSGGPLVNMQGQVVGIDSAGADTAENIGFAIAIDSVKSPIQQAIANPLAPSA